MSQSTSLVDVVQSRKPARTRSAKPGRYFYSVAAVLLLMIMVSGFYPYYLRGEGMSGRKISPSLVALVLVHGTAMTAWLILFFVQSLLIPVRRLRLHMKLGWGAVAVASVVSVSGFMVAVQSVRQVPSIPFWGMAYSQFLMVM